MSVREKDNPRLYAKIQEQNLLRQYDLLSNCIEIGLAKGIEFFDKYTPWALNYAAVANISQFGGRYREEPIYVGNHFPPHFKEVPNQMDRFFSVVHENWEILDHPTMIPAYALWRLNWIHPFVEGNGENREGRLLLPALLEAGPIAAREENRAGTNQGKSGSLLRRSSGRRPSMGSRPFRCFSIGRLSGRPFKRPTRGDQFDRTPVSARFKLSHHQELHPERVSDRLHAAS